MTLIRAQHELLNSGHWQATLDYYTPASRNFGRPVGRAVMSRIFAQAFRSERHDAAMMQQLGLSPPPKPFDWAKFAAEANAR
jgi:hypothetical protein